MKPQGRRTKVLLTRSNAGNIDLAKKASEMGFEPLIVDALETSPPEDWSDVDSKLKELDDYGWVLVTSARGAGYFAERARKIGVRQKKGHPKVGAVGRKTAETLAREGWAVDFVPSRFLTEVLGEELPSAGRALLLRSDIAGGDLGARLRRRGFEVDEVSIYRTRPLAIGDLEVAKEADVVAFGSASAVEAVCSQLPRQTLEELVQKEAACIGPVTSKAARERGFRRIIEPAEHTFDGLLREIGTRHHAD